MLKAITHYEQVPLGLVMKILEKGDLRKESKLARPKNKRGQNAAVPASSAGKKGA